MGGWLDQVGIRLTQLSTKLKLKLKLSLAIRKKSARPKKCLGQQKWSTKNLCPNQLLFKENFDLKKFGPKNYSGKLDTP